MTMKMRLKIKKNKYTKYKLCLSPYYDSYMYLATPKQHLKTMQRQS